MTIRRSPGSPEPERPKPISAGRIPSAEDDAGRTLTTQELGVLTAGFRAIRDQEPLDDVADWANAVVALLEDEAAHASSD